MVVNEIKIEEEFSLFDYLQGGWQLSLSIAIDFTGSNGDPSEKSSLHYLDGQN
jgi:copine 5/8/9